MTRFAIVLRGALPLVCTCRTTALLLWLQCLSRLATSEHAREPQVAGQGDAAGHEGDAGHEDDAARDEGHEEASGPRPDEGDAARDEGHEVSWESFPVVRSGSRVLCAGSSVWVPPHLLSVGRRKHLCEP